MENLRNRKNELDEEIEKLSQRKQTHENESLFLTKEIAKLKQDIDDYGQSAKTLKAEAEEYKQKSLNEKSILMNLENNIKFAKEQNRQAEIEINELECPESYFLKGNKTS